MDKADNVILMQTKLVPSNILHNLQVTVAFLPIMYDYNVT